MEAHLHPLFMLEVPCTPDITRARKAVLDWLSLHFLEPRTSLLELSAGVLAREVYSSLAAIPRTSGKPWMHFGGGRGGAPPFPTVWTGTCIQANVPLAGSGIPGG